MCNRKRIRDKQGSRQQNEVSVRDRTDAEFTHGSCPECAKEVFPEVGGVP